MDNVFHWNIIEGSEKCWKDYVNMMTRGTFVTVPTSIVYPYPDGTTSSVKPCNGQIHYVGNGSIGLTRFQWDEYSGVWVDVTPSPGPIAVTTGTKAKIYVNGVFAGDLTSADIKITSCSHEWVPYEGFTQRYNYCKKCDIKDNV